MPPSGPSATLPGGLSPPKLPLGSVNERCVSGAGAMISDRSALSCRNSAARQPTRQLRSSEVGSCGGRGIGGN